MRIGETERSAAVEQLTAALVEQRLTVTEFDDRLKQVMAATTEEELAPVVADLPISSAQLDRLKSAELANRHAKMRKEWLQWFLGAVLLTGIWGVISLSRWELQNFWPAIPIGIWAVILVAEMFWPSDDKGN